MDSFIEDYQKYRWFITHSGKLVVGGKSAVQNDMLLEHVLASKQTYRIMHTVEPGSPFMVLCAPEETITPEDSTEMAIVTACFSKAWKQGKSSAQVHSFSSTQIHKGKGMKPGTWGVYGKVRECIVPLKLTFAFQRGILRAIPPRVHARKKQLIITPGSLPKDELLPKLDLELDKPLSQEAILQSLPAGNCKVTHE